MMTTFLSRTQWRYLSAPLALMLLFAPASNAQDNETTPPSTSQKASISVMLAPEVNYKEDGTFSDAARAECPLEKELVDNLTKVAGRYQLSIKQAGYREYQKESENSLSMRIDHILGGRPGNGFGGRWVISELGVTSTLGDPANPGKSKYHFCSAGLGANPFANFGACQRLQRCAEQISGKIAAWLRQELLPKAEIAKISPLALPAADAQNPGEKP